MIEITVPLCEAFREIGIDISEADLKRFERALYERGLNVAQRTSPPWHREMIDREPDHGQYAAALADMTKNRKSK
jgi:hypothetical protein